MISQKIHYYGLDILRLFAAFWVMNFHYFLGLSGELSWYRYGNLGVPLFFIISGFVISQSISTSIIKNFAIGRLIRLFPLFWILCTATYLFTLIMPNGNPVSFSEYLISMTMLGDKFGAVFHLSRLVDPVYWSLTIELIFYFAIGLFVYFFTWKKVRYFLWGWLLVSCTAFLLHVDQNFIMKTLLVRHASYFIFGAALALIINHKLDTTSEKISDYILLMVTATYSSLISYRALPPYFVIHPLDEKIVTLLHPVFFISVIALIYFSKNLQSDRIKKICILVGGITYPLYLIHQTVGIILIDYLNNFSTHTIRGILTMIPVLIFSYYMYFIDKLVRSYINKKFVNKVEK